MKEICSLMRCFLSGDKPRNISRTEDKRLRENVNDSLKRQQ